MIVLNITIDYKLRITTIRINNCNDYKDMNWQYTDYKGWNRRYKSTDVTVSPTLGNCVPIFLQVDVLGKRCGSFFFIWSSCSQVNSGPRLDSQRSLTIGMRLRLRVLISRSIISTGFSTKCKDSSIWMSSRRTWRFSSARHFLRLETWKVGWTLLSSWGRSSV